MVLFEYIIKVLVHNSETLFIGLLVILVGYYGRILWDIKGVLKEYTADINFLMKDLSEIKTETEKLKEIMVEQNKTIEKINNLESDIEDHDRSITARINEKTEDVKDTLKILITCYRKIDDEEINIKNISDLDKILQDFSNKTNRKK